MLLNSGHHGLIYIITFSITNITFVVSIQNTNVANTLVMIAMAPMLSAILGAIFLKEMPNKKTWIAIFVGFIGVLIIMRPGLSIFDPKSLIPLAGAFFLSIYQIVTRLSLIHI